MVNQNAIIYDLSLASIRIEESSLMWITSSTHPDSFSPICSRPCDGNRGELIDSVRYGQEQLINVHSFRLPRLHSSTSFDLIFSFCYSLSTSLSMKTLSRIAIRLSLREVVVRTREQLISLTTQKSFLKSFSFLQQEHICFKFAGFISQWWVCESKDRKWRGLERIFWTDQYETRIESREDPCFSALPTLWLTWMFSDSFTLSVFRSINESISVRVILLEFPWIWSNTNKKRIGDEQRCSSVYYLRHERIHWHSMHHHDCRPLVWILSHLVVHFGRGDHRDCCRRQTWSEE